MTTSQQPQHLFSVPIALAVAAACVSTLAAAQQAAAPQTPRRNRSRRARVGRPKSTRDPTRLAADASPR